MAHLLRQCELGPNHVLDTRVHWGFISGQDRDVPGPKGKKTMDAVSELCKKGNLIPDLKELGTHGFPEEKHSQQMVK